MRTDQDELPFMAQHRRDVILDAAIHVLATEGLNALSMQAVAKRAGVAKSVVLYYVGDRQLLLWRVFEELGLRQDVVSRLLRSEEGDPRQLLGQWLNAQFELIERADAPIRLTWLLQADREHPAFRLAARGIDGHAIGHLSELLARGHTQACWRAPDAQRLAMTVKALTDGYLLQAVNGDNDPAYVQKLRAACRGAVMDLLVR